MFRSSGLWRILKRVGFLREMLYLGIELSRRETAPEAVDGDFRKARDPWHYESSPAELARFRRQTEMLAARRYARGLEVGCAEGKFTAMLADMCDELEVLDISPLALERTRSRCVWHRGVSFRRHDLANDPLDGRFDLIVVAGVLEYFPKRKMLFNIQRKLVAALQPDGTLLVESTRAPEVVEEAFWHRWLPRGRRINEMLRTHPRLTHIATDLTEQFAISVFRKQA